MAVIARAARGNPGNLTVVDVPGPFSLSRTNIWHNDLDADARLVSRGWSDGAGLNELNSVTSMLPVREQEASVVRGFALDAPLVTHLDADRDWNGGAVTTEIDAFGCLETGGNFEGVLVFGRYRQEEPWSLPRYKQAGTTLDCDTSAPLGASSVFVHHPASGLIIASGSADGAGVFSVPVFEPGPHLVRAVNGTKTVISLPVIAETA